MHGVFPTIEQWDALNKKTLQHRLKSSQQWDDLDRAVRAFSADQTSDDKFRQLKAATEAFVSVKTRADGVFHTTRDANGIISALRDYVAENPPSVTASEQAALREVILENKKALFRGLTGSEIRYKAKQRMEMAKTLKEDAEEFKDSLLEVPAIAKATESSSSASSAPAQPALPANLQGGAAAAQMKSAWDQIIREACSIGDAIPDAVLTELKAIIGQQLFNSLSSAIPYLGTIKEGAAVMTHLKNIARHELTTYRVKSSTAWTRPGDVQAAVDAMVRTLESERIDLGIELAGSSATFAAGIGTLGADGGTLQVVTSLAITGAKLIRTIYVFVSQHVAMTQANKALKTAAGARMPLLETLHTFPFLGAHLISVLETSTILDINIADLNQPFFKYLAEDMNRRIETVRTAARKILDDSRFEIVNTDLADVELIRARDSFLDSLQDQLNKAIHDRETRLNRKKMDAVIRDIPAAAAKFQERRDRAAHEAKFKSIAKEAAGKISLLEMLVLANLELEAEMAALIDIRAMEEQREAELRRNKALAKHVQSALNTYKEQTTGFRRFTTRQSDESTAAIQVLSGLVASQKPGDLSKLRQTTEYLLKITSSVPNGVPRGLSQLKEGSRLHGLLAPAYGAWSSAPA
jgi:hypothetical protein